MTTEDNIETKTETTTTETKLPASFSDDYVRALRKENKDYRLKASEYEASAKTATENADKATKEANQKIADANSRAEERIIKSELKAHAVKAGMVDLDGLKLLDLSKVKLAESGEVEGADALIEAAKVAKPWLFGAVSTSSTTPVPKPAPVTNRTAKEMSADEIRSFEKQHGIKHRY